MNLRLRFVFFLTAIWVYSGWPLIFSLAQEAASIGETATSTPENAISTIEQEATSTSSAEAYTFSVPAESAGLSPFAVQQFDFPIGELKILVGEDKKTKIDLAALTFNLPPEAGELEFYAIQDGCPSTTPEDIRRNILSCPESRDPIGFPVLRPDDYNWVIDRPTRIVVGACRSKNIDCGNQPEDFLIGFISQEPLLPDMPAGAYPLDSQ